MEPERHVIPGGRSKLPAELGPNAVAIAFARTGMENDSKTISAFSGKTPWSSPLCAFPTSQPRARSKSAIALSSPCTRARASSTHDGVVQAAFIEHRQQWVGRYEVHAPA